MNNLMEVKNDVEKNYKFEKKLGAGAFGDVWKGVDVNTGKSVAIKIIKNVPQTSLSRLDHEIKMLKYLLSKNICEDWAICFIDFYKINNEGRIVLDFVDGLDLEKEIMLTDLDDRKNKDIMTNLITGLDILHQNGISHQDIKPENIMWDNQRNKYVYVDFGLACLEENCCTDLCKNAAGTRFAIPPEICKNVGKQRSFADIKAHDIWSLGITLFLYYTENKDDYEDTTRHLAIICAGNVPEYGNWDEQVLQDIIDNMDVSKKVEEVLKLMLEYDPIKRLQNWEKVMLIIDGKKALMESGNDVYELKKWLTDVSSPVKNIDDKLWLIAINLSK